MTHEREDDFGPDEVPHEEELDVEAPNESAPGHNPEEELEDLDADELDGDDVI